MRSKLFRSLLVENVDQLLSLSIGFKRNHPLPPPASVASVMRSKAIEFLEKWNDTFGIHYRQLRLGYDYLKNTLRYQFPNLQANAARARQERQEREMRTKEILLKKFEALKANYSSVKEEIQSEIDEIDECLEILRTKEEDMPMAPLDEEVEEYRNSELRQIRLDSLREGEKVEENTENKVVFDALRESYKVLVTKHLATIQEWISLLIRVEVADIRFRDSALKDLIDIKNLIQSTKRKCEESGCNLPKATNAEEDVIWEEGTIESFKEGILGPTSSKGTYQPNSSTASSSEDPGCSNNLSKRKDRKNDQSSGSKLDPLRSKLLTEAPVLNWGSYLDNWGSDKEVLANQRGLDVEGHWGRVDYDAVIPAKRIAELNVHTSIYEEDPVDIPPCRAPLAKGGLCQRRDLRVCPFHGVIIPRDDKGNPINENSATDKIAAENQLHACMDEGNPMNENSALAAENQLEGSTQDADSNVVDQLLKQAVKNVRERDRESAKNREIDKQALKRAKLAKVREHNESVLRDAAIASTSRSFHVGEDIEVLNRSGSSAKSKKQTLASMLKRKETSKDRLAQRLLNSRARDATIRQLTEAEDSNYREAFPNQW